MKLRIVKAEEYRIVNESGHTRMRIDVKAGQIFLNSYAPLNLDEAKEVIKLVAKILNKI